MELSPRSQEGGIIRLLLILGTEGSGRASLGTRGSVTAELSVCTCVLQLREANTRHSLDRAQPTVTREQPLGAFDLVPACK